eukprot:gb/GECG01016795.1/.p1 GENE.gb/GECG01016795.1/~~gb/GECG01016795.1/.p1  ORF type:complete len:178 (+),score=41.87 gb/GECG01016795.1/:1-534(+)
MSANNTGSSTTPGGTGAHSQDVHMSGTEASKTQEQQAKAQNDPSRNEEEEEEEDDEEESSSEEGSSEEDESDSGDEDTHAEGDKDTYFQFPLATVKYCLRKGGCEPSDEAAVKFAAFLGDRFGQSILRDVLDRIQPHPAVEMSPQGTRVLTRDTLFEAFSQIGLSLPKSSYHMDADS